MMKSLKDMAPGHSIQFVIDAGDSPNVEIRLVCKNESKAPCREEFGGECILLNYVSETGADILRTPHAINIGETPVTDVSGDWEEMWVTIGGVEAVF